MRLSDLPQAVEETTVPPDHLEVDGDNPNEQNDATFGLLCENMRNKGWIGNAIVANSNGLIADGEHRWRAAQEIGLEEVPVKFYDIDDSERRLWRQELNKISGEHDKKRDALEYQELLNSGKSDEVNDLVQATGEDLDELLAEIRIDNSLPPAYEYDPEHNVYFEDCVEGMQTRLEDNSVDCVITDPPYSFSFEGRDDRKETFDEVEGAGEFELIESYLSESKRVLRESGHIYMFWTWKDLGEAQRIFSRYFKHLNTLIWDKGSIGMSGGKITGGNTGPARYAPQYEVVLYGVQDTDTARSLSDTSPSDVLQYDRAPDYSHPTEKPAPLISHLLKQSTSRGDVVLDPFMGSGTTAVAAIQNDRGYIGFELDKDNYKPVIERRIGEAKRQVAANAGD